MNAFSTVDFHFSDGPKRGGLVARISGAAGAVSRRPKPKLPAIAASKRQHSCTTLAISFRYEKAIRLTIWRGKEQRGITLRMLSLLFVMLSFSTLAAENPARPLTLK